MANSLLPDFVLLEDANDTVCFIEAIGRTVPRDKWVIECIQAKQRADIERMLGF